MPQLESVIQGVKRKAQKETKTRFPITMEALRGLKQVWQKYPNQRDASMLWAAATLCFFEVGILLLQLFNPQHACARGL